MTHEWPVLETATEYETGWYDGGYDRVEQPDGSTKRYYWADLPPAVVVVALDGDEVVFVEQYRPTIREECLELPAGIVEDGESMVAAAARELAEETGLRADSLEHLQTEHVATGVLRHERGYVVAESLASGDPDRDDNEYLRVVRRPREEAIAIAREEPTNDATLQGLLLASADGHL
ncbi:MAG: NUDIX hydrolase [Halanaeroarchaeum sp.]